MGFHISKLSPPSAVWYSLTPTSTSGHIQTPWETFSKALTPTGFHGTFVNTEYNHRLSHIKSHGPPRKASRTSRSSPPFRTAFGASKPICYAREVRQWLHCFRWSDEFAREGGGEIWAAGVVSWPLSAGAVLGLTPVSPSLWRKGYIPLQEQDVLDALCAMFSRIYTIGPLPLMINDIHDDNLNNIVPVSGKKTRNASMAKHKRAQVARIVVGDSAMVPPEFVEETKDRSKLTSWCPQEQWEIGMEIDNNVKRCGVLLMVKS
ncbi:hypothetical protein BUALT_Bualt19G0071400 [Buddleja alternifolia]|uniref:Uncharacterized protein n=1 Tax=Buddleja alternifolia TaxID=168488 RepID=A0AAV6WA30_9LAMI|nr:hypothetical protein BUALT_Bualt19G0071400 [Buddleja alternifolia]